MAAAAACCFYSTSYQHTLRAPVAMTMTSRCYNQTGILRFDVKSHAMEKRRRRELEKAGIDPDVEEELPWIAPEEQQRIDEEEAARKACEEERRKEFLAKRASEDEMKRKRFKEFRARQIAMSQNRKEEQASRKEELRAQRGGSAAAEEEGEEVAGEAPAQTEDGRPSS